MGKTTTTKKQKKKDEKDDIKGAKGKSSSSSKKQQEQQQQQEQSVVFSDKRANKKLSSSYYGTTSSTSNSKSKKKNRKESTKDSDDEDDQFRKKLQADGLSVATMAADGNCLFRSLSDQLYGDYGNHHEEIRSEICDYMEQNKDDFQVFLVLDDDSCQEGDDGKDFESYIRTMRGPAEWGGNLELVAAARLYERKVTVFSVALSAYTIDPENNPSGPNLLLSFHDNDHYNSIRDEKAPPQPPVKRIKAKSKQVAHQEPEKAVSDGTSQSSTVPVSVSAEECTTIEGTRRGKSLSANKKTVCPCGSGLRYRKCCLVKEKHAARLAKMKGAESQNHRSDREGPEEKEKSEMIGSFHVLKV